MSAVIILFRPIQEYSLAVSVPYHEHLSVSIHEIHSFNAMDFFKSCRNAETDEEKKSNIERVIAILNFAASLGGNLIELMSIPPMPAKTTRTRLTLSFPTNEAMLEFIQCVDSAID